MAGGTLRLARPEILPLSTSHDPEAPLRALAGAAAGLADGEHAVLQVLARPVTGARLRKARRAARRQRAGQPARHRLPAAGPGQPRPHGASRSRAGGRADPDLAAEIRETTAKLAGPAVGNPDPLRRRHHRRRRRPATGPAAGNGGPPPRSSGPGCAAWPTPWPRRPPC